MPLERPSTWPEPTSRIFDTTLRDGEQAPGFSLRTGREAAAGPPARRAGRGHHRGRLPDRLAGRRRGGAAGRRRGPAARSSPRWRAAAATTSSGPARRSKPRRRGRASTPSSPPPICTSQTQAEHHARAVPRGGRRGGHAGAPATPTTCSSRRRTPRAATSTSCAASSRRSSRPARPRSTCPTRSATRRPTRSRDFFTTIRERVPNADQAVFSAHCHDDLGLAVANTHRRRARPARARSSARSTASASAPATPRSKRSSWRMRVRPDRLPFDDRHRDTQRSSRPASCCRALTGQPVQANKAIVGATRSRTRRASTRTAC